MTSSKFPVGGVYPSDDGKFTVFPSRRSVVHSQKAIVSTTSPLATQAGLQILKEGGNAADAAVAAAAVLNVVDPAMTGIGGDAFCLFYNAKQQKVHALNGSGRSPKNSSLDGVCERLGVTDRVYGSIPTSSALSVTVPGVAAAWVDIVERHGSGVLSLAQVLAPAIRLAEEGFLVSEISSYPWVVSEDELRGKPNGGDILKPDPSALAGHRAPRAGEFYKNPLLAQTFRRLGEDGRAGFYEGAIAKAIVEAVQGLGGFLDLDDLREHARLGSEDVQAVAMRLRQHIASASHEKDDGPEIDLWEHPPNGQGIVAQMALGILQILEDKRRIPKFGPEEHNSSRYLHAVISALRIAFADGSFFITDTENMSITPKSLLSNDYLSERANLFDPDKAVPVIDRGTPVHNTSDTIYLAVTDSGGNACSLVNSIAETFGSRIIPAGTGFVLHSRGSGFHLDAAHPNAYAPGKRPYNTIIPALITHAHDGSLHTVLGVMGGAMQPQGHVQVILNMLTFGMNPQVALDAPRICIGVSLPGKSTDPNKKIDTSVYLEEGISEQVARELEAMGHEVKFVKSMARSLFGRGQVIRVGHDTVTGHRVYSAGSDMRGDGAAAPLI